MFVSCELDANAREAVECFAASRNYIYKRVYAYIHVLYVYYIHMARNMWLVNLEKIGIFSIERILRSYLTGLCGACVCCGSVKTIQCTMSMRMHYDNKT